MHPIVNTARDGQRLPLRRKLALAKLGPQAVDELIESGDFDDLAELSEKEFKAQLRDLQALRARVLKLEDEINARDEKSVGRMMRRLDHPELVHRCRIESVALAEHGDIIADELERLCRALVVGEGLSGETEQARAQIRAASTPLRTAVMSLASRLFAIGQGLRDELGHDLVPLEMTLPLAADEADEINARRIELKSVLLDMQVAKRRAAADVADKRPRGRPSKAKK